MAPKQSKKHGTSSRQPATFMKKKKKASSSWSSSSSSSSSSPYHQAASMLNEVWTNRVSLKSLAFAGATTGTSNDNDNDNEGAPSGLLCSKTAYAQASNALRCKAALDDVVHRHNESLAGVSNRGLLYVLLYELLEGPNRAIKGGGSLKRMILKIESDLRKDWEALKKDRRHSSSDSTHPADNDDGDEPDPADDSGVGASMVHQHPRYVRVNTLRATTPTVVQRLDDLGIPHRADDHVPDLRVIPTRDATTTQQLVQMAPDVILQDKSSCLPALCLLHGYDGTPLVTLADGRHANYVDACAAPGNKTLHLAALVASALEGSATAATTRSQVTTTPSSTAEPRAVTVHAFDKDPRRCRDLARRVDQHANGTKKKTKVRVNVECQDFLSLPPSTYPDVGAILLDPTCSGSGSHHPGLSSSGNDDSNARLTSLSRFQLAALRHAMAFPHCQRIVYSTCSIYDVENELVVAAALQADCEINNTNPCWTLVPPRCLSGWKRRGRPVGGLTPEQASALIRVDPSEDKTGGFFVACFERRTGAAVSTGTSALTTKKRSSGGSNVPGEANVSKRPKGSRLAPEANGVVVRTTEPSGNDNVVEPKRAAESSSPPNVARPPTKKRLKKLQWKRRQREEKERRLKQHKSSTATT